MSTHIENTPEQAMLEPAMLDIPDPAAEELLEAYRWMLLARRLDERMWQLIRQGKGHFAVPCQGHEAVATPTPTRAVANPTPIGARKSCISSRYKARSPTMSRTA